MQEKGVLDNFPLHLLVNCSGNLPVLILDNHELGRVQLNPLFGSRKRIIVLSPNINELQITRKEMFRLKVDFLLVVSDFAYLPFRNRSIAGIVAMLSSKNKAGLGRSRGRLGGTASGEFNRIVSSTGWFVRVIRKNFGGHIREQQKFSHWAKIFKYYVRPSAGDLYFVTRECIPDSWPFKSIQIGRLKNVFIHLQLLISRIGINTLSNGLSLIINLKTRRQGAIERWVETKSNVNSGRIDNVSDDSSFGLLVKTGSLGLLFGSQANNMVVKFPLSIPAAANMGKHLNYLNNLSVSQPPALKKVLPQVIDCGNYGGQAYWRETKLPGVASTQIWWMPWLKRKAANAGFHFLLNFHLSTLKRTKIVRGVFDELIEPHADRIEARTRSLDPAFSVKALTQNLWLLLGEKSLPLVNTHGDFWPGNLLISKTGDLTGVLDWDTAVERGWPLLDLLHLLTFQKKWLATWYFGWMVTHQLMKCRVAKWQCEMIQEYCASLGIPQSLWPGFVALYWLTRASKCIELFGEKWIQRNIIKQLPILLSHL